ncbi:hypothetical protein FRC03_011240 [Tulasnella sp. 419]|nr:hypothetical protein FRC03_011240 [Tulasnella sp. 419]
MPPKAPTVSKPFMAPAKGKIAKTGSVVAATQKSKMPVAKRTTNVPSSATAPSSSASAAGPPAVLVPALKGAININGEPLKKRKAAIPSDELLMAPERVKATGGSQQLSPRQPVKKKSRFIPPTPASSTSKTSRTTPTPHRGPDRVERLEAGRSNALPTPASTTRSVGRPIARLSNATRTGPLKTASALDPFVAVETGGQGSLKYRNSVGEDNAISNESDSYSANTQSDVESDQLLDNRRTTKPMPNNINKVNMNSMAPQMRRLTIDRVPAEPKNVVHARLTPVHQGGGVSDDTVDDETPRTLRTKITPAAKSSKAVVDQVNMEREAVRKLKEELFEEQKGRRKLESKVSKLEETLEGVLEKLNALEEGGDKVSAWMNEIEVKLNSDQSRVDQSTEIAAGMKRDINKLVRKAFLVTMGLSDIGSKPAMPSPLTDEELPLTEIVEFWKTLLDERGNQISEVLRPRWDMTFSEQSIWHKDVITRAKSDFQKYSHFTVEEFATIKDSDLIKALEKQFYTCRMAYKNQQLTPEEKAEKDRFDRRKQRRHALSKNRQHQRSTLDEVFSRPEMDCLFDNDMTSDVWSATDELVNEYQQHDSNFFLVLSPRFQSRKATLMKHEIIDSKILELTDGVKKKGAVKKRIIYATEPSPDDKAIPWPTPRFAVSKAYLQQYPEEERRILDSKLEEEDEDEDLLPNRNIKGHPLYRRTRDQREADVLAIQEYMAINGYESSSYADDEEEGDESRLDESRASQFDVESPDDPSLGDPLTASEFGSQHVVDMETEFDELPLSNDNIQEEDPFDEQEQGEDSDMETGDVYNGRTCVDETPSYAVQAEEDMEIDPSLLDAYSPL